MSATAVSGTGGLLLVDKDPGWTSHDVVAKLRGILQERRIGHAGTLDPMASGLLVVAVGPATRLLRFATGEDKAYEGEVTLGAATNTLDADGDVVATSPVPELTDALVAAAAAQMCGPQLQVPPMVSAVRVGGRRLYEIARAGEVVERAPRPITVRSLSLTRRADDRWAFVVSCTAGTYVRVLLADWAERLGTLGHLSALRRTASGSHHVAQAHRVESVATSVATGDPVLSSPVGLVGALPVRGVSDEEADHLRHGRSITRESGDADVAQCAAVSGDGTLVAVLTRRDATWRPAVVLSTE